MTSVNLFTPSGTAPSQATLGANTDSASQTEGQALYQQASQSPQPEAVVKRQFEQRNRDQKTQLANEFIESAGREGINHLATTPEGQHALAVVYAHAEREGRDLMRQVHEEQGNTAVDYSCKQNGDPGDPLSVGDTGVKIGPRINGFQYTAMTAGVVYGLAEHVVTDLIEIGKAVGKESQRLKDVDSLEFLDIDKTGQKSDSPGLSMPSWQDIGTGLKRNIQATNQAITTAKEQGEYFIAGKAISNDPMLQMTGLGDLAVFGTLAKMRNVAKLESLALESPKKLGTKVSPEVVGDGSGAVSGAKARLEVIAQNNSATMQIKKTASGSRDVVSAGSVSHVNPTGSLQNCTNCVFVVDNQISTGAKASALPRSAPLPFNEIEELFGTKMSGWTNRSTIESTLLNSGNGTRAVVYGMDDAGVTAHVWNAVVQKGKINYIDGQIGRGGDGNFDYFPNLQFGIIR